MNPTRLRALAAFDFEEMRLLIEDVCTLEGHLCVSCNDARDLREMLAWLQPDLLVFDERYLERQLKWLATDFPQCTLVALTSDASPSNIARLTRAGVFMVLEAPFVLRGLNEALLRVGELRARLGASDDGHARQWVGRFRAPTTETQGVSVVTTDRPPARWLG